MAKFLILYPTCQITHGAIRSTISDLEKNDFHYIPNDLADVIDHLRTTEYDVFLNTLGSADKMTIEGYKDFLLKNDLAFFTDRTDFFPGINLQFFPTSKIANAILDWNGESKYDIFFAIAELNRFHCKHLQLRFYSEYTLEKLGSLLEHIQNTDILSVDIFYKYKGDALQKLKKFMNGWVKIKLLVVHSAPFSKIFILNQKNSYTSNMGNFAYTTEIIDSEQNCGCISQSYFTVNLNCFSESQQFNTCLKNKLSIDVFGKIKNCPTILKEYGELHHTSFEDVLNNPDFQSYGNIKKDQIEVCKDCEHRHFCTDCRGFVTQNYDKPQKCSYDPYTAKWN